MQECKDKRKLGNSLYYYHTQVVFCSLPPLQVVLVQLNQMAYSSVCNWVGSL